MLFPLLATRVLARNVALSPRIALRYAPATQITRSFSVSSVAWASEAATKKKTVAKKTPAKKRPASTSAKKPAAKKAKGKKAAAKPKKKVAKKPAVVKLNAKDMPPKRPGGAYATFYGQFFVGKTIPEGLKGIQIGQNSTREAAAAWHNLSDPEKQSYRDQAERALEEYKKQLEEYANNVSPAIVKELNRRRVQKGKRKLVIKYRRYNNGFILFTKEERKKRPSPSNLAESRVEMSELAKIWNALSDEQKAAYKEKAIALNATFKK